MFLIKKIPLRLRRLIAEPFQKIIFNRSIKKFILEVNSLEGKVSHNTISALIYGWGNQGYSAKSDYMYRILKRIETSEGDILECGSGLSTLLMAIVGKKNGKLIHSLEENEYWYKRMLIVLEKYSINNVRLHLSPIKKYDNFSWYSIPENLKSVEFSLIICDGPSDKSDTGRYGLLPLMNLQFLNNSIILADDFKTKNYNKVVKRWMNEFDIKLINESIDDDFVEIVFNK